MGGPSRVWSGPCVKRPSNHGVRLYSAPLQAADDAPRFLRPASVERCADMERCLRMGAAMPPHQKIKRMRIPASAPRTEALAVKGSGKVGIGGQAASTQLIEQIAQLRRRRGGRAVRIFHFRDEDGERLLQRERTYYMEIAE
jgi:hypothetical protein